VVVNNSSFGVHLKPKKTNKPLNYKEKKPPMW